MIFRILGRVVCITVTKDDSLAKLKDRLMWEVEQAVLELEEQDG